MRAPRLQRCVCFPDAMLIPAALHQPFAIVPNASSIPDLDEKLVHHDKVSEEWFRYWDEYYEVQGLDKGNFLREARECPGVGSMLPC